MLSISRDHCPSFPMSPAEASPPSVQPRVVVNNSLYDTFQLWLSENIKKSLYQVSFSSFKWKCNRNHLAFILGEVGRPFWKKKNKREDVRGKCYFSFPFKSSLYHRHLLSLVSFYSLKYQLRQQLIFPNASLQLC